MPLNFSTEILLHECVIVSMVSVSISKGNDLWSDSKNTLTEPILIYLLH